MLFSFLPRARGPSIRSHGKGDACLAELDDIAVGQRRLRTARAVDAHAVALLAAHIGNHEPRVLSSLDDGVIAVYRGISQPDLVVWMPADANHLAQNRMPTWWLSLDRQPSLCRSTRVNGSDI